MKLNTIFRIISGLVLCYGIYTETGVFTVIFAITMLGYTEFDFYIKDLKNKINQKKDSQIHK